MKRILMIAAGAVLLAAEEPAGLVSGPVLGLVPEGEGYRVLRGAPGSLDFAEAVMLPAGTLQARVAPRHEWLLVEREGGLEAFDWRRGRSLNLQTAKADAVAFSPSGGELALWYAEAGRLLVLAGLPLEARVARDEKRAEAGVRALAISDGGREVVGLGAGGSLMRLAAGGSEELHRSDDISSFVFLPGRTALVVGDRIQNAVLALEQQSGGWRSRVLLSAADGLDDPDGVWAGAGDRVAVASYRRSQVWIHEGGEWSIENVDGLRAMDELQLRDTLLAGGSLVVLGQNGQRLYRLPRREE